MAGRAQRYKVAEVIGLFERLDAEYTKGDDVMHMEPSSARLPNKAAVLTRVAITSSGLRALLAPVRSAMWRTSTAPEQAARPSIGSRMAGGVAVVRLYLRDLRWLANQLLSAPSADREPSFIGDAPVIQDRHATECASASRLRANCSRRTDLARLPDDGLAANRACHIDTKPSLPEAGAGVVAELGISVDPTGYTAQRSTALYAGDGDTFRVGAGHLGSPIALTENQAAGTPARLRSAGWVQFAERIPTHSADRLDDGRPDCSFPARQATEVFGHAVLRVAEKARAAVGATEGDPSRLRMHVEPRIRCASPGLLTQRRGFVVPILPVMTI